MVHASVRNSFIERLPDMQFDFKVRSGYLYIYVLCIHRIFLQTDSITFALLLTIFYMILMITLTIINCYINTVTLEIKPKSPCGRSAPRFIAVTNRLSLLGR